MGIALDVDAGTADFYKNGVKQGSTLTHGITGTLFPLVSSYDGVGCVNFGQRPFAYTAPSGYKCLNTANLPDPTIADGSTAFDAKTFTANNGTQTISGFNFSPDLIWTKSRANAYAHQLWDQVRGTNKALSPNDTSAEANLNNSLAFTSDGFTSGTNNNANYGSGGSIAWAWDAGSSTVTNTDGSISAQVRANPSAGFSIVSYTGSSSAATVGHGLNAAPEMIIVKDRDNGYNWQMAHVGIGADESLILNGTNTATDYNAWNASRPTSSVFSLGAGTLGVNTNGADLIAYCFAPVEQYSSFGSFLGNGSTDGPFVFLDFAPAFLLVKRTDITGNWILVDQTRGEDKAVYPNSNISEASASFIWVDFVSNGFKIRNSVPNASGGNYLYAAFAENPFKTSRAR